MKTIGASLNTLAHIAPAKAASLGLKLFCRPIRPKITKKQQAFFNTATQETFMHNGQRIQTYRWGKGSKKILMLHGWQSHSYRWKNYVEALHNDYTVYTLDAPGHGLSGGNFLSVPLYGDIIETQIQRMGEVDTILTHSLGGFAAFYALHHNQALTANKMIALASPGEAQEFFDFFTNTLRLSEKCVRLVIKKFETRFEKTPAYFSAPAFAETLSLPGLIIHDEHDGETPFHHAERIHRAWKNSTLIKTNGFGHNLKSNEVVDKVVQFIQNPSDVNLTKRRIANSDVAK